MGRTKRAPRCGREVTETPTAIFKDRQQNSANTWSGFQSQLRHGRRRGFWCWALTPR